MKSTISKAVLVVSCLTLVLNSVATCWYISGLRRNDGDPVGALNVLFFIYILAPVLGALALACAIISAVYVYRAHQARDLWSLYVSGVSLLGLIAQELFWLRPW